MPKNLKAEALFSATFFVAITPKAQPRARARAVGAGKHAYARVYPVKSGEEYKATVATLAAQHRPPAPVTGPVSLGLTFWLPRPKSHPAWKSEAGTAHTSKPDIDNLAKAIMDALKQGGYYRDDSQVVAETLFKTYARGHPPGVEVSFEEWPTYASKREWQAASA